MQYTIHSAEEYSDCDQAQLRVPRASSEQRLRVGERDDPAERISLSLFLFCFCYNRVNKMTTTSLRALVNGLKILKLDDKDRRLSRGLHVNMNLLTSL